MLFYIMKTWQILIYFCQLLGISLLWFPECRQPLYMIPGAITITYAFFVLHPSYARSMHSRKLTYEDLEDFRDAEPELRKRFQIVFTRVQQIGGALCAGLVIAYAWNQYHTEDSLFKTLGVLGGLLSLYAKIFGYIGTFCISCLYRLKKEQDYSENGLDRTAHIFKKTNPNRIKPENTEQKHNVHK